MRKHAWLAYGLLVPAAALSLAPLGWLVSRALHADGRGVSWGNFRELFLHQPFGRWLLNSIFLTCTYTVLVVLLSALGGFALAKYRFWGKRAFMGVLLLSMLMPAQVLLPGSYELMRSLGWINSYAAIVIPGLASVMGVFLFRQAMQAVPDELLAAARLDGCSELRIWWEVALPLARPMIAAFALLSFLAAWNSFLWPQIILQDQNKYTLPMAMANLAGFTPTPHDLGLLAAGTLAGIAPVMVLFLVLQKEFMAGLTTGVT